MLLGNTVSEGVSCGIMLAFAARTPEFRARPDAPLHPYTRKELYDILWPVEGSRMLASALQAAESSLIPCTLTLYTGSRAEAMAQYGSLKGMALPLVVFPFSGLGALSGLLMPEITRAHTRGDLPAMLRLIFTMLRLTGAFSLAAGAGFVVFGAPLAQLVYRDADVGRMVQVLGFVAPFMYLESMVDGVLKGLGRMRGGAALLACEWVIAGSLPLISQRAGALTASPLGGNRASYKVSPLTSPFHSL